MNGSQLLKSPRIDTRLPGVPWNVKVSSPPRSRRGFSIGRTGSRSRVNTENSAPVASLSTFGLDGSAIQRPSTVIR